MAKSCAVECQTYAAQFSLREFAWGTVVTEPTPLHPQTVFDCEQCLDQLCAGDAIYLPTGEYREDIKQQHNADAVALPLISTPRTMRMA
jgi:hypothetical protein